MPEGLYPLFHCGEWRTSIRVPGQAELRACMTLSQEFMHIENGSVGPIAARVCRQS